MKSRHSRQIASAAVSARSLAGFVAVRKVLHHIRAALRDERERNLFTAAFEWREAAELFGEGTVPAEYCWREWERIMRLPRRLASPISDSNSFVVPARQIPSIPEEVTSAIAA